MTVRNNLEISGKIKKIKKGKRKIKEDDYGWRTICI
jgi:hypothetical protein